MQERFLFEYAVIRFVPKVEREEFINVGIILYCKSKKFLDSLIVIDQSKILAFSSEVDLDLLREHLQAFSNIALGKEFSGTIGSYEASSRFRWLTATRSTIIQCSKVHPGLCIDPKETLNKLQQQLVL